MKKYDLVLLMSGGLDSTVLFYDLISKGMRVLPLFLDYGQHCVETELRTLKKVLTEVYIEDLHIINIADVYRDSDSVMIKERNLWEKQISEKDMYLPYRNLLFMTIAVSFAQSNQVNKVYSAFINSNHAKEIDCSTDFFKMLNNMLSDIGYVNIELPYKNMTKVDVLRRGIQLNAPLSITYSCQVNSTNPCGSCPNCVERLNAIKEASESNNG
ncbi:7-cyano-7-deazaguanine synthase [Peloplasma aerotolerans]|uniref:7-cyano-7-deazaguanine synthase n=1 Tax=Peloplasma aerotolerans TaxID=3044389 RepID=A0AAW6UAZ1_9MOLU|nr:7-cyano-7-deazaguanine synthase [Mariniplasma sp. M4Ah]MDI6452844.1 7-cyano-7-deazaguanine synthase [Mariniplasma sp. M4Ah]